MRIATKLPAYYQVVAEVVYLPPTINSLPGAGRELVLARCRRRGIVSRIFNDRIAATLCCRIKTGNKSNVARLIDGEILC